MNARKKAGTMQEVCQKGGKELGKKESTKKVAFN